MRTIEFLSLAAILLASYDAAVVKSPTKRYDLSIGNIGYNDKLLLRQYLSQLARPNIIQYQDVIYRGNITTRITSIQAYEINYTQYASVWITSGGLYQNNVTLRVQSARGYGYNYQIDIWGY